jgi:glycosyltransferase involved in cell wall biosynthesis
MKVTVAICTWNRARLLDQTLTALRQLRVPPGVEWELLVVNNNCTDDTDAVIGRHASALPLRRLVEPKQGHSHARNCAVAAAQGDLLIWTDDDVHVDPDWLTEYVKAAEAWPDAGYFVGTVDPWFAREPPAWVRRHLHRMRGIFVIMQRGPEVRPLREGETGIGASMGFRTAVLRQFPFDVRLGRVRDNLVGGDDSDVLDRVRKAGHAGVWVGTARLQHFVPEERLTMQYVRRWYRDAGPTFVRANGVPAGKLLFGVPRWALRQYCQALVKSWLYRPFRGPRWFEAFRQSATLGGFLQEVRSLRQSEREAGMAPVVNS